MFRVIGPKAHSHELADPDHITFNLAFLLTEAIALFWILFLDFVLGFCFWGPTVLLLRPLELMLLALFSWKIKLKFLPFNQKQLKCPSVNT